MDRKGFEQVSSVVAELGYSVEPVPEEGQNVRHFDVVSYEAPISPQSLLNKIHDALADRITDVNPVLNAAQQYVVSFRDLLAPDNSYRLD